LALVAPAVLLATSAMATAIKALTRFLAQLALLVAVLAHGVRRVSTTVVVPVVLAVALKTAMATPAGLAALVTKAATLQRKVAPQAELLVKLATLVALVIRKVQPAA
jgi:hypothetical protein